MKRSKSIPDTCPLSSTNRRPRALVMDDDPVYRTMLNSMLKRDFTVVVASDGAEGFYKALEIPPNVAIIDIQMPGWDGLRTLKAFRDHDALSHIPLLVLSSDATQNTLLEAISAGADDYLIKTSFSREELLSKLQELRLAQDASLPIDHVVRTGDKIDLEMLEPSVPSGRLNSFHTSTVPAPSATSRLQETIDAWE